MRARGGCRAFLLLYVVALLGVGPAVSLETSEAPL